MTAVEELACGYGPATSIQRAEPPSWHADPLLGLIGGAASDLVLRNTQDDEERGERTRSRLDGC